jgi:outer membrane protein assembly factor BamD
MRKKVFFYLSLGVIAGSLSACKGQFEKIRTSSDPEVLYKAAFDYYDKGEYQKAQTLLELVIAPYRGRKEAEEIYYRYAYTYYHMGQYQLASYYFKNFAQTFSTSTLREEVDFMDAYSNYRLSPGFRLDQSNTEKAIDAFQLYINTYPDSDRVPECNRLIDEMRAKMERKTFEEGKLYFDLRHYQSAIHSFENLLKDFPETNNAEQVRYMIIRATYLLAENSVIDRQEERYRQAYELANEFLRRYAGGKYEKEIASIRENSQRKINKNV